ncbi:MAG: hypothetical protein ACK5WF_13810 [Cyclobacteriaceae bacterium]
MYKIAAIVSALLLIRCGASKTTIDASKIHTFRNISSAISYENSIGSVDTSPNHTIELADSMYPNHKGFELAIPKMFQQVEVPFICTVSYYYVKKDSSIKVIFYQWDNPNPVGHENEIGTKNKFKRFKNKWNQLAGQLSNQLGKPHYTSIASAKYGDKIIVDESTEDSIWSIDNNSTKQNTTWRDDMKWKSDNGVNAYMFMFGDNRTGYRQIRLVIYGD